jgi:cysteinyl-tRNA synthetase
MEASKNGLERILTATYNLEHLLEAAQDRALNNDEKALLQEIDSLIEKFDTAMDDDFNTADAIAAIFEIVKAANSKITSDNSRDLIQKVLDKILLLCDILGIQAQKKEELLAEEVEQLIQDRQDARKNRDFAKADEIRNLLLEKGIILEDTREGVRWKRA